MVLVLLMVFLSGVAYAHEVPISGNTQSCLNCHKALHPGIVKDWEDSRHSHNTMVEAMKKPELERRVSADNVDDSLSGVAVGCYECHSLNTEKHEDNFFHYGFSVNIIVSSADCATCHPKENEQYLVSKKGHAWGNLKKNPVYHTLYSDIIGLKSVDGLEITSSPPSAFTEQEACFACHGTKIEVEGMKSVSTTFGIVKVPRLKNWPNQGVGRINPDGSRGSCTPCHARHAFSIEVARKPYTCAQCHLEPDVPAWNVYAASKHGNIFLSNEHEWDFNAVPWKLGEHFTAPTCATCHVSLVTSPAGAVIAERNHDFASRLWVRLFGLIYTHPQPKTGDTSVIKNKDDLPMPTAFTGEKAFKYLIDEEEQNKRKAAMTAVCRGCHNTDWINEHFVKMDNTLEETDAMTLAATKLMLEAWGAGVADDSNPFDEAIERKWILQWLFYGNTARYASAMTGAQDYVAFKYGWWGLTTNLQEMRDKIETKIKLKEESD
jgi:hypothetical protein